MINDLTPEEFLVKTITDRIQDSGIVLSTQMWDAVYFAVKSAVTDNLPPILKEARGLTLEEGTKYLRDNERANSTDLG